MNVEWIAPAALVSLRAVHFAACLGLAGFLGFDRMLPRSQREGEAWQASLRQANGMLFPLLLVSGFGWFLAVAQAMGGDLSVATIRTVWAETAFGQAEQLRVLAFLLAGIGAAQARRDRPRFAWMALAGAGALLGPLAWTGHGGTGPHPLRHRIADVIHLLAAGVWPAGLLPLFCSMRRERIDAGVLRRFSAMSLAAVAALTATGWINAACLVGSWAALFHTPYGWTLLAKLFLFLLLIALGAVNLLRFSPRLAEPGTAARLARNVRIELAVALALVALVALLGWLPPPGPGP